MVDGLNRLRHHAVVSSYNKHDNIGHLCSPCPHRGKRLMARSVKKDDILSLQVDLICSDMLRDTPCLGLRNLGLPYCIKQRCLAVVNMAHDRYDRGTVNEFRYIFLDFIFIRVLFCSGKFKLDAEIFSNQKGCIGINGLVDSRHIPHLHKFFYDIGYLQPDKLCKLLD